MSQGRWVLIVGIMLSVFAVAFQSIGIATALPTVMGHFDAAHLYPWAFTTFISGMLLAIIFAGRVADVRGPSLPIYVGFAMFGIGLRRPLTGRPLEAVRLIKSWDFEQASFGLAAINAFVNDADRLPITENPDAFLEKHKQRWRSNSTKKDSD